MSYSLAVTRLLHSAERPFEDAIAMPPDVYTNRDFLDRELRDVFGQEWVCVGRASTLATPGDYLTYELAGQPVLVIRDRDGTVRAMSNVCLHRMSTLLEGSGHTKAIVCPYHAWMYNLDGTLRGAPYMSRTTGFCKDDYHLQQMRCEERLG